MAGQSQLPNLMNKMRWHVAKRLPGQDGWDKMKVVGKGLQPVANQSNNEQPSGIPRTFQQATLNRVQTNPFLSRAMDRNIAQRNPGVPLDGAAANLIMPKTGSMEKTARVGMFKSLWKSLSTAGRTTAKKFNARRGVPKTPKGPATVPEPWKNLFKETAAPPKPATKWSFKDMFKGTPPGTPKDLSGHFQGMTGSVFPAIGRMFGGSYIGSLADDPNQEGMGRGAIIGGLAGLASPGLLRTMGSRKAAPGTLRRLFADKAITNRLANDPLNRIMLTGATGDVAEAGLGALGFNVPEGWGRRIGVAGGLLGGARPWGQALAGASPTFAKGLGWAAKTKPGQMLSQAQTGGFGSIPGIALGSPYAGQVGMIPIAAHSAGEYLIGDRVRELSEKKKIMTQMMDIPQLQPIIQHVDQTVKQLMGPQAGFYGPDGLPSREAMYVMHMLGEDGLLQLQRMGQTYFGNPNHMLDPTNWERLANPGLAAWDAIRGNASRFNPLPF